MNISKVHNKSATTAKESKNACRTLDDRHPLQPPPSPLPHCLLWSVCLWCAPFSHIQIDFFLNPNNKIRQCLKVGWRGKFILLIRISVFQNLPESNNSSYWAGDIVKKIRLNGGSLKWTFSWNFLARRKLSQNTSQRVHAITYTRLREG